MDKEELKKIIKNWLADNLDKLIELKQKQPKGWNPKDSSTVSGMLDRLIIKLPNDFEVIAKGEAVMLRGERPCLAKIGETYCCNEAITKYFGKQIEIGIRVIPDIENESKD